MGKSEQHNRSYNSASMFGGEAGGSRADGYVLSNNRPTLKERNSNMSAEQDGAQRLSNLFSRMQNQRVTHDANLQNKALFNRNLRSSS